jgi:hypothetical protein
MASTHPAAPTQLVEPLAQILKFKGLNQATPDTGKDIKNVQWPAVAMQ